MKKSGLMLVLIFLSISLVSATIEITQPLENYNFGDTIFTTVTVNPSVVSGNFEINVVCGNESVNVYKISPAESAFVVAQEQKINHKIILTKEFLGNLAGTCNIIASLGKEVVSSNAFSLTNDINVNAKTDKYSYEPGEAITLTVEAIKSNGRPLNGFLEASSSNINFAKEVVEGNVQEVFSTLDNAEAGNYQLSLLVYDSDDNGILNEQNATVFYEIKQVPKSIMIVLPANQINPGTDFEFSADLYDQSGKIMENSLTVLVLSPLEEKNQFGLNTGETGKISFPLNATPGDYRLIVSLGTLAEEKVFKILAVPKLSFEMLENSSILTIRNIGNAPFNDFVNISIGENITDPMMLNVLPGEERRFNLKAPTGLYNVKVSDGTDSLEASTLLTGRAIQVTDYDSESIFTKYPFIWAFIAVILLAALIIYLSRTFNKSRNYRDNIAIDKKEDVTVISAKAHMRKNNDFLELGKSNINEAESALTMKGNKDFCTVVSLNIKNNSSLGANAKNSLNNIINSNKDSGVVDWKNNHALIIYSSKLSGNAYKNELNAAKAAWKIKLELDEYNRKFTEKIQFNIGINCGDLIASREGGKFSYTSLGSTVILAKRLSERGTDKVLVSIAFRQKLMREIKVNKVDDNTFEITRISDTEANESKLKDLLKRTNFS